MLDVVCNEAVSRVGLPFQTPASEPAASPELALLSRQTCALEYIATQLGLLSSHVGQTVRVGEAIELQPEYALATRRLLQEAV